MSIKVVYVHGLWQTGREAALLRRRLAEQLDAEALAFSYRSLAADVSQNARALGEYLAGIRAETLHLVGHSLGGVTLVKLFDLGGAASLPPGRIVLLGPPLRGSATARNVARWPWGHRILGLGMREEALDERERRWTHEREIGVIAGDLGVGVGRLFGSLTPPHDGTVRVAETRLEGASDTLLLRVSHTGMLFSAAVARQAGSFLRDGRFARP